MSDEQGNKTSNYERIKSMTIEELHSFLLDFEIGDIDYSETFCELCTAEHRKKHESCECEECLMKWLRAESTEPFGIDF